MGKWKCTFCGRRCKNAPRVRAVCKNSWTTAALVSASAVLSLSPSLSLSLPLSRCVCVCALACACAWERSMKLHKCTSALGAIESSVTQIFQPLPELSSPGIKVRSFWRTQCALKRLPRLFYFNLFYLRLSSFFKAFFELSSAVESHRKKTLLAKCDIFCRSLSSCLSYKTQNTHKKYFFCISVSLNAYR